MGTLGVGSRVRCVRPEGQESWAVDGMVGTILRPHVFACVEKGDHGIPMGKVKP